VAFVFHAGFVHADDVCRRLTFADRNDERAKHYFVMDRSEESREEAVTNIENVYIERDDQCWGGYGGIKRVVLERDSLTLHLGGEMANRMGGHVVIGVTFDVSDAVFRQLRHVLGLIMRGYESQLVTDTSAGGGQVFELTMDNAEDQDQLNRRLRKPGEADPGSLPKGGRTAHGEST
jgi:hypothetical protein